jgi:transposase
VRSFSAAEKLRIVTAANACTKRGEIAALMRREGIYSSLLSSWRREFGLRGSDGLGKSTRGRKPTRDAKDARIAELEKSKAQLEQQLRLAQELLALQKKASELLGLALPMLGRS